MALDENPQAPAAAEQSDVALLLIDVINDFDFPEADQLLRFAVPMAQKIAALKQRAVAAGVPVIYVNDNFGRWRSDLKAQLEHCTQPGCRGRQVAELLHPTTDDYFVLKPKHSGFYSTTLEPLLDYLGVGKLILTGVATDICVLFTANDAYMRDYKVLVPADCTAANTEQAHANALQQISCTLKGAVCASHELRLPGESS